MILFCEIHEGERAREGERASFLTCFFHFCFFFLGGGGGASSAAVLSGMMRKRKKEDKKRERRKGTREAAKRCGEGN